MKLKKAISILKKHNNWRQWDNTEMENPKVLTEAIDTVVKALEDFIEEYN